MTGKTSDGKEIFKTERIYMPQSTTSRDSDEVVYGPFRKVGIIRDTSLQPLQTKEEIVEILFPYEDVENS